MNRCSIDPTGILAGVLSAVLAMVVGCEQPVKTPTTKPTESAKPNHDRIGDVIRRDPVGYLESCLDRCKKIDAFTTTFYRRERLGIVPALRPVERILAKWRRSPLSIKFDLPDDTSEYAESVYVEGQNDNKLKVLPRHGLLGLPPTVGSFPVSWSILFHKAKNPITDFGPQRMLERTLYKIGLARKEKIPGQIIEYKGVVELQITGQVAHHIQITNPNHRDFPHAKQNLYIDAELQIPAGSYLWTKDGLLDAMYLYADMTPNAQLTDADFTIKGPPKKAPPSKAKPKAAPKPAGGKPEA